MTTQKKSQRRSHIGHLFNRLTSPLWFIPLCLLIACDSGTKELLDIAIDEPERKEIDVTRMGVNSFFVNPGFGSIQQQYSDIHENMGLNYVRVLFAWTNGSQPTPNSEVNYGLFDNILSAIPAGTDVLVVVAHTPDWMSNPANWTGGNPRATWVEKWLSPVVNRYKNTPGIVGWEIWNEPDNTVVASDAALGLEDPANYFELLSLGSNLVRRINPGRLVVPAATTAINQNYPENLNYNKRLVEFVL